jgi:hypothetical protein
VAAASGPITPPESPGRVAGARLRAVRWHVVLLGVAVAVGSALRLTPVETGFWFDELFTAWAADPRLPLRELWPRIVADPQPPPYYALMWAWHRLAGYDPAASRLLGGLLSALALPIAWAILARVLRPLQLLASVGALALAWFGIYYAHEARAYALLYAFAAVGYALVTRSAVLGRTRRVTAALLAVALAAGLVHYFGMVLGCALFLARATGEAQRRAWRSVRRGLGWTTALGAIFVLMLAMQAGDLGAAAVGFHRPKGPWDQLVGYRHLLGRGRWGALGLLALGLAAARPRMLAPALPYATGIAASIAAPAAVSLYVPILTARYLVITAPPLLLAMGRVAGAPGAGHLRAGLVVIALTALGASSTAGWPRIAKPGWRETAALVQAMHTPGCPLPVYAHRYPPGVYGYFLTPRERAAVVAVGRSGPLPALATECRVRLWIGDDFGRRFVQPPPDVRVVDVGKSAVWLAPAPR